jgi:hypothetical protein
MSRFSSETEYLLKASGWFEGRSMPTLVERWQTELERPNGFSMSRVARQVLNEFGGLHIWSQGTGSDCARSDIDINPLLGQYEESRFFSFTCLQGKQLFPLGEAVLGHLFVTIDQDGNVYLIMEFVIHLAKTFDAALENLLLGKQGMLLEEYAV